MPLYEFRQVEGAGTGTFATQDIPRYTQIMQEEPLVAMETERASNGALEIWKKFDAMSDEDRAKFGTLVYSDENLATARKSITETLGPDVKQWTGNLEQMAVVAATYWTNDFACSAGPWCAATYHVQSKLNHSCANNMLQTTLSDGSQCMMAVRNIKAGEELTCPYMEARKTYSERQTHLRLYGFTCMCPMCGRVYGKRNLDPMLVLLKEWFAFVQEQNGVEQRRGAAEAAGVNLWAAVFAFELGLGVLQHILDETHKQTGLPDHQIKPTYNNIQYFTNALDDIKDQYQ
ncbi:hypothetical protein GTA08_BOTSDO01525 [Botryosphaeria dothidea]|uniref:SET domain-containing protein n=1 Tax=Botryosphaeria dothidea TaxID=55169 RepID=A0A8H4N9A7_9PEZI|nr:hypothetical protein GTA08_BOTSDO01525 [Botryosphaeria dothidea]